jgi:hypothetical protein
MTQSGHRQAYILNMTETQEIPWKRLAVEAVAIVGSILLAFAIDAWWEVRQDSAEEQTLLRQLEAEFELNAELLAVQRSRHEENMAAAHRLLTVTGPILEKRTLDLKSIKQDIHHIMIWWTYDPQMGVLNGMIQSGKLGVISSDRLRSKLANWPAQLRDLAEDELFLVTYSKDVIMPLLSDSTSIRNISFSPAVGDSEFSDDIEDMLVNRKFENAVHLKLILTEELLGYYDDAKGHIDNTLALIEEEIRSE